MNEMLLTTAVKNTPLFDFFMARLKELYAAEKFLTKTFPRYRNAAAGNELKRIFSLQLEDARDHAAGLEAVSCILGRKLQLKKNDAVESIVMEGERIAENLEPDAAVMDIGLMLGNRKLIHYMIPTYNGLIRLSLMLGFGEISARLKIMLDDEQQTDSLLNLVSAREKTTISYHPAGELQKMIFPRSLPLRAAGISFRELNAPVTVLFS